MGPRRAPLGIAACMLGGGVALAQAQRAPAAGEPAASAALARPAAPRSPGSLSAGPPCPEGMVLVKQAATRFCVDRYEGSLLRLGSRGEVEHWPGNHSIDGLEHQMLAVSRQGVPPQGYISGAQASVACANAGKRLCSLGEWSMACRGPRHTRYPYGNQRRAGVCNDRFHELTDHPVSRLFQAVTSPGTDPRSMWLPAFMNDPRLLELPRTVQPTGAARDCSNEYGTFDMVGNLHEWVADPRGVFAGGFFMDTFQNGEGCDYRTRAHRFSYHDYSTGFRCCVDAPP
jgi:sulfatase modifying factor 1